MDNKSIAIVTAAGSGTRMNTDINKLFMTIGGMPILAHSLIGVAESNQVDDIIITARETDMLTISDIVKDFDIPKIKSIIRGGDTRTQSVYNGLLEGQGYDIAVIHDGARPFISPHLIDNAVEVCRRCGAVTLGVKLRDTVKRVNAAGRIIETVPREELMLIQTPQIFDYALILKAHENARTKGIEATDDCGLVEALGQCVYVLEGEYRNIKITTPEDIEIAEAMI